MASGSTFLVPSSPKDVCVTMVVWLIVWAVLFFAIYFVVQRVFVASACFQELRRKQHDVDFVDRIAGTVHAVAMICAVIASLINDDLDDDEEVTLRESSATLLSFMAPSIAWFGFDFCVSVYTGLYITSFREVKFDLLHHIVGIIAEGQLLGVQHVKDAATFAQVTRLLLLTEITTPILHVRWMLIKFRFDTSSIFHVSVMLLLGFLVFRVGNGLYMLSVLLSAGPTQLADTSLAGAIVVITVVIVLTLLNTFWTGLMLQRALVVLRGRPDAVNIAEPSSSVTALVQHGSVPDYSSNSP